MTVAAVAVLDSSVALKWVLLESGRERALIILDAFESGSTSLLAPRLFVEEIASALSKRCRRRQLSAPQVWEAFAYVEQRRPWLLDGPDLVPRALSLSVQHDISLWDAIYLALAIEHRCELYTADRRFHRSTSHHYPFVELIA